MRNQDPKAFPDPENTRAIVDGFGTDNWGTRMTTNSQRAALERLIRDAQGDTGQSRIVANFLLAWWNAAESGGFDLTDVWGVDTALSADMLQVFALVVACQQYPDTLDYGKQFQAITCAWFPGLVRE